MPVSERAPRPRSEYAPPLRTIFSRIAATTALVLCDRDNLSPLKEFRDISSSRVRSVAKTRRNSDRRRGRYTVCTPSCRPPLRSTHWADTSQKSGRPERRVYGLPQLSPGVLVTSITLPCVVVFLHGSRRGRSRGRVLPDMRPQCKCEVSAGSHASPGDDSVSAASTGTRNMSQFDFRASPNTQVLTYLMPCAFHHQPPSARLCHQKHPQPSFLLICDILASNIPYEIYNFSRRQQSLIFAKISY